MYIICDRIITYNYMVLIEHPTRMPVTSRTRRSGGEEWTTNRERHWLGCSANYGWLRSGPCSRASPWSRWCSSPPRPTLRRSTSTSAGWRSTPRALLEHRRVGLMIAEQDRESRNPQTLAPSVAPGRGNHPADRQPGVRDPPGTVTSASSPTPPSTSSSATSCSSGSALTRHAWSLGSAGSSTSRAKTWPIWKPRSLSSKAGPRVVLRGPTTSGSLPRRQ